MSQLITFPDIVEDSETHTILLIDPDQITIELVVASCKTFNKDYNIYISGRDVDPQWLSTVIGRSQKVFINENYSAIVNYLKEQDV